MSLANNDAATDRRCSQFLMHSRRGQVMGCFGIADSHHASGTHSRRFRSPY